MRVARLANRLIGSSLLVSCAACVVGSDAQVNVDVAEIVSTYHGDPRMNPKPYASSLGAFDINVYISPDSAAAYGAIEPERSGSHAVLPPGTVIVRQVVNPDQTIKKLTLMVKGTPGANPTCGDWWFGVTDPAGRVLADADGNVQAGPIAACEPCHIARASDDYLFGVPAAYR